ncbi:MAG TPA: porin [Longimicrobiales bacterium]|nr:porin [Longimicrobiales bacterium]
MDRLVARATTGMLLLALGAPAAAQERPEVTVEVTGRGQFQFSTSSVADEVVGEAVVASQFEERRIRVGVNVAVGEWVTAKLEPDFAGGRVRLADAFVALDLDPAARLRIGKVKRPFSLMELTSSTRILPVERGARIRGLSDLIQTQGPAGATMPGEHYAILDGLGYTGRDIGAALSGRLAGVGYEVGVYNGTGTDAGDVNDAKTVAGRLTWRPSATLPLTFGGAAVALDRVIAGETGHATAFEVDVEYGGFSTPGLHLMAEAAFGDGAVDASMRGAQAIAAWFLPLESPRMEGLELVGRASWGDPSDAIEGDEGLLLTPGVNLYVLGLTRLMLGWDVYLPSGEGMDTAHALRAQANVYF